MAKKIRLDQLLVQHGLAETRNKAQALILAGVVRIDGHVRTKAGEMVAADAAIEVDHALPYASRGGYKLAHALDAFAISAYNLIALDVGASTGGFTDVLLQRGAARVYAVDVGYGLIDWRLRQDPRVIVIERTNIRYLDSLPPLRSPINQAPAPGTPPDLRTAPQTPDNPITTIRAQCATIDVSFISLRLVLPAVQRLIEPEAWVIALIKPQFEAGAGHVGKGGVVRDRAVHHAVLRDILLFAESIGLPPHGLVRSPITGPAGNIEFLAWLGGSGPPCDIDRCVVDA